MTEDLGHEWGKLVMGEGNPPPLSDHLWCRKCGNAENSAAAEQGCPNRAPSGKRMFAGRWVKEEAPF